MMHRLIRIPFYHALLLVSLFHAAAFSQEAPPKDPPSLPSVAESSKGVVANKEVQALLADLENGDEQTRDRAEASLVKLGTIVLSQLPKFPASIQSQFRTRVDRIRDQLQSQAILEYANPSIVTLQGKLPLEEVLLELMDQTDNELQMENIPTKDLDVNFQKVTFWEAFDQVLDEIGYDVGIQSRDRVLLLVPNQAMPRSSVASYAGLFRLEPLRIDATRMLLPSPLDHVSVDLEVSWEPRIRPAYIKFPMMEVSAECDNGELLKAVSPDATPEYSPNESSRLETSLSVSLPSRDVKKLLNLSGVMLAAIPGAPVQIEFDRLQDDKPKSQQVGKLDVTLLSFKKRDDIYESKVRIKLEDSGETMDSFRGWLMTNEIFLLDPDGRKVNNAGWQTTEFNREAVGLTYFFDIPTTEGYRLGIVAPGAVTETRVEFTLKDIPLP